MKRISMKRLSYLEQQILAVVRRPGLRSLYCPFASDARAAVCYRQHLDGRIR